MNVLVFICSYNRDLELNSPIQSCQVIYIEDPQTKGGEWSSKISTTFTDLAFNAPNIPVLAFEFEVLFKNPVQIYDLELWGLHWKANRYLFFFLCLVLDHLSLFFFSSRIYILRIFPFHCVGGFVNKTGQVNIYVCMCARIRCFDLCKTVMGFRLHWCIFTFALYGSRVVTSEFCNAYIKEISSPIGWDFHSCYCFVSSALCSR